MALPIYAMTCFLLSKSLLACISGLLAAFWWKNKDTGTGIHWKSWFSMTKRKEEGGMSFRELEGFNKALLEKQFWRICTQPQTLQTLFARILKAKYFPSSTALYAKLGSRPSYGWRSILASQDLMKNGITKEFGNRVDLQFWSDPWILNENPRAPLPRRGIETGDFSVDYFREEGSDEWMIPHLEVALAEKDCKLILNIKPGGLHAKAIYSWIHTNNGVYSVKSGYRVWASSKSLPPNQALEQLPNYSNLFAGIWKTKAPPSQEGITITNLFPTCWKNR